MNKKLSIKEFLHFSFFLYPLAVLAILYEEELSLLIGSDIISYALLYAVFSIINFIWGQYRIQYILLAISAIVGFTLLFYVLTNHFTFFEPSIGITIVGAFIVYFLGFFVFQFAQFLAWIPFIFKYLWQNRYNLDNMTFE